MGSLSSSRDHDRSSRASGDEAPVQPPDTRSEPSWVRSIPSGKPRWIGGSAPRLPFVIPCCRIVRDSCDPQSLHSRAGRGCQRRVRRQQPRPQPGGACPGSGERCARIRTCRIRAAPMAKEADLSRHPSQEHLQAWRSIARTVLEADTRPGSPRTLTHGAGHLVSSSRSSPKVTANWGSRSA